MSENYNYLARSPQTLAISTSTLVSEVWSTDIQSKSACPFYGGWKQNISF